MCVSESPIARGAVGTNIRVQSVSESVIPPGCVLHSLFPPTPLQASSPVLHSESCCSRYTGKTLVCHSTNKNTALSTHISSLQVQSSASHLCGKVAPVLCREYEFWYGRKLSFTSALDGREWSPSRSCRVTPGIHCIADCVGHKVNPNSVQLRTFFYLLRTELRPASPYRLTVDTELYVLQPAVLPLHFNF
jgi:hypothetical protein